MPSARQIPLFPLSTVLFPGMLLPLHIFENRYKMMIQRCIDHEEDFGVVFIQEGSEVGRGNAQIFDIGTTAQITHAETLPDGRMHIATVGMHRIRVIETDEDSYPYMVGMVEEFPLEEGDPVQIQAASDELSSLLLKYLAIIAKMGSAEIAFDQIPRDATALAFLTAIVIQSSAEYKQELLSIPSLEELLRHEKQLIARENRILKMLVYNMPSWSNDPDTFSPN